MSFNNPVVGGENGELVRRSIQSPDYVAGVSGWTINRDGSAEFNNVTIRLDLATGSIVVGPDTGPQVVIRISGGTGLIQFPTNSGIEATPASIQSSAITNESLLVIDSAFIGGSSYNSSLTFQSGNENTPIEPSAVLGAYGSTITELTLTGTFTYLDTPLFRVGNEIRVSDDNADVNYPLRITHGKTVNANTITTLPLGVDTEVATSDVTSAYLINGRAYAVSVNLSTRSSVGTSAAGTMVVQWKLWDGAVGGTQLGVTVQKTNGSVGTIANDDYFRFTFVYTGTTGSKTLRISGNKAAGADTFQAIMNTASNVLVTMIGDPAQIINL